MKVLTIDRTKWRRGGDQHDQLFGVTTLLNHKGYMCCLGFDALACGISESDIRGVGDPEDLINNLTDFGEDESLAKVPREYLKRDQIAEYRDAVNEAIQINDDRDISDEEREERLIPVLKRLGWDDVRFIN